MTALDGAVKAASVRLMPEKGWGVRVFIAEDKRLQVEFLENLGRKAGMRFNFTEAHDFLTVLIQAVSKMTDDEDTDDTTTRP